MFCELIKLPSTYKYNIPKYSVFAECNKDSHFVNHVGFITTDSNTQDSSFKIKHISPPLRNEQVKPFDYVAIIFYTRKQLELLETKLENDFIFNNSFYQSKWNYCYVVHPYKILDPNSGLYRYSCVGFVLDCLETAEIQLFNVDSNKLPCYSIKQLSSWYPMLERYLGQPNESNILSYLGLSNDPNKCIPVILPGYAIQGLLKYSSSEEYIPIEYDAYLFDQ